MQVVTHRVKKSRRCRCKGGMAREMRALRSSAHRRHRRSAAEACKMIVRGADPDTAFGRVAVGGYVTERDII